MLLELLFKKLEIGYLVLINFRQTTRTCVSSWKVSYRTVTAFLPYGEQADWEDADEELSTLIRGKTNLGLNQEVAVYCNWHVGRTR